MDLWSFWLILVIALVITEVLTQTMWSLCFAIGALAALVCSVLNLDYLWQGIALVGGAIVAYMAMLPWIKKRHHKTEKAACRTGMDALMGRKATVTHEIRPEKPGRVRIDGDNWQVKCPGISESIPAGTEIVITGYDSIILIAEPAKR